MEIYEDEEYNELVLSNITKLNLEIMELTSKGLEPCSLDTHGTKHNWVEDVGGLPTYICLAPETKVLTRSGSVEIVDLEGPQELLVRLPQGAAVWRTAEVKYFGRQELLEITLKRNKKTKTVYATPEHNWYIYNKYNKNAWTQVQSQALQEGDSLVVSYPQNTSARMQVSSVGVLAGMFFVLDSHRERVLNKLSVNKKQQPDPWKVVSVKAVGRVDDVYCAVVPDVHNFTLEDNILTGNCNVAKEIHKSGKDISTAIAMAISQIKKWIADPKTSAETKAKATAAIAEWERKKAQARAS